MGYERQESTELILSFLLLRDRQISMGAQNVVDGIKI